MSDPVADKVLLAASGAQAGGGTAAVGGLLLSSHDLALGGLVVALASFALQAFLGWRRDRREQREHDRRMR